MSRIQKGKYRVQCREKYLGDSKEVVYRSSWERKTFTFLDTHPKVKAWASEEIVIPYKGPDGKPHRYFPDLYIEMTSGTKLLVEIKPALQTKPPKLTMKAKHPRRFLKEAKRFAVNHAKWTAAKRWCENKDLDFHIWTEKTLIKTLGIQLRG
jgi:hypothetical protein